MNETFDFLDMSFFTRASIFPGSVGTFRYRFQRSGWLNKDGSAIQVWVYENTSFELAQEIETETFPWTEEGVEQIKAWLEQKLMAFPGGIVMVTHDRYFLERVATRIAELSRGKIRYFEAN